MLVSTVDHSPDLGGLAIGGSERGTVKVGETLAMLPLEQSLPAEQEKVTELYAFEGLDRVEVGDASAGEIVALAGIEGGEIGYTVADLAQPERLGGVAVEGPTISVDFLVTHSPLPRRAGRFVTPRPGRERLT